MLIITVEEHDLPNVRFLKSEIHVGFFVNMSEIVSEYNQELPQSQTADNTMTARGRATQQSRDTRKII